MLQQQSTTQIDLISLSKHSSINTEASNQKLNFVDYAKIMTDILLLEDGSEESSTIWNKTATTPEVGVIYNIKEEFKKALRLSTVKNHF